jgi:hypothetical protein
VLLKFLGLHDVTVFPLTAQYGKEQSDLQAEKDLIREIMRLLGILEDRK